VALPSVLYAVSSREHSAAGSSVQSGRHEHKPKQTSQRPPLFQVPAHEIQFGDRDEDAGWIDELDFMSWDLEKRGGVFTGGDGVEYRWKSHRQRLQLVQANDDTKVPVAQYHIYRRYFVFFRMSRHAFLEIKPEVTVEGLEKVIVSYLLVERRRRDTQKFRNYL